MFKMGKQREGRGGEERESWFIAGKQYCVKKTPLFPIRKINKNKQKEIMFSGSFKIQFICFIRKTEVKRA